MTELTKKMVEERAKELWSVYFYGSSWKQIDYPSNQAQKNSFERLATYTLASELRARIEEACKIHGVTCTSLFSDCSNCKRIKLLTEQLKDLGEVL